MLGVHAPRREVIISGSWLLRRAPSLVEEVSETMIGYVVQGVVRADFGPTGVASPGHHVFVGVVYRARELTYLPERSPGFIKSQLHVVSQVHVFSSMSMSTHFA